MWQVNPTADSSQKQRQSQKQRTRVSAPPFIFRLTLDLQRMREKPGGVPRTPSGKIQPRHCRRLLLERSLPLVSEWRCETASHGGSLDQGSNGHANPRRGCRGTRKARAVTAPPPASTENGFLSVEAIRDWLIAHLAAAARVRGCRNRRPPAVARYGLTSRDALEIAAELEQRMKRRLSPSLVYDYPSIDSLSRNIWPRTARFWPSRRAVAVAVLLYDGANRDCGTRLPPARRLNSRRLLATPGGRPRRDFRCSAEPLGSPGHGQVGTVRERNRFATDRARWAGGCRTSTNSIPILYSSRAKPRASTRSSGC